MKKAIGFTAFDRVEYLNKALASWSDVRNLRDYDFYFFIEPSNRYNEIVQIIKNFQNNTNIKTTIISNPEKLGCATNTWSVFEFLFKLYDFVILAEDDVVVSKDVLEYFNFVEEKYRNDEEIAIVSANTKWDTKDPIKLIREQGFNGLIWGTWKKYWTKYFEHNWEKEPFPGAEHSGWDWHLNINMLPFNKLKNINPMVSRSNHIGLIGEHCTPELFDLTISPSFNLDNQWDMLEEV